MVLKMEVIFNNNYIKNNELLFFIYLGVIILMILITIIIGYKENKKWDYLNYPIIWLNV